MTVPVSPYESAPPSGKKLLIGVGVALAGAVMALVCVVLPAEYNIDPTGIGSALGLTALNQPTKTIQIVDVVGGNENYKNVEIPKFGDPVPLPNPAVFQVKMGAPRSEVKVIELKPGEQTEIKSVLKGGQMILFSWRSEGGEVYVDFHGHDPAAGDQFFVRYEEQQSGTQGHGSLVAPFEGEHGWYWLNISDKPVKITLELSGYYDKVVDYGKSMQG